VKFQDLAHMPEDDRIAHIIREVVAKRKMVGVVVDDDPPNKAERYRKKLAEAGLTIHKVGPGPVPGTTLIRVGP